jgi:hypothetical protein
MAIIAGQPRDAHLVPNGVAAEIQASSPYPCAPARLINTWFTNRILY